MLKLSKKTPVTLTQLQDHVAKLSEIVAPYLETQERLNAHNLIVADIKACIVYIDGGNFADANSTLLKALARITTVANTDFDDCLDGDVYVMCEAFYRKLHAGLADHRNRLIVREKMTDNGDNKGE